MENKSVIINTRVKPQVKEKANKILESLGLTMSDAIAMYLQQIILRGGIPFTITLPDPHMPNAETIKSIEDSQRNFDKLPQFDNIKDMLKDLKK